MFRIYGDILKPERIRHNLNFSEQTHFSRESLKYVLKEPTSYEHKNPYFPFKNSATLLFHRFG